MAHSRGGRRLFAAGFVTLAVEVVTVGSGSFTIQFDADTLQNYPGSALFALPGSGTQPIEVSEGSVTGWIYASIYLTRFPSARIHPEIEATAHVRPARVRHGQMPHPRHSVG